MANSVEKVLFIENILIVESPVPDGVGVSVADIGVLRAGILILRSPVTLDSWTDRYTTNTNLVAEVCHIGLKLPWI